MSFSTPVANEDAGKAKKVFERWSLGWLREFLALPHEDLLTTVSTLGEEISDLAKTDSDRAFRAARALECAVREHLSSLGIIDLRGHPVLDEANKIFEQYEHAMQDRVARGQSMFGPMVNRVSLEEGLRQINPSLTREVSNCPRKVVVAICLGYGLVSLEHYQKEARLGWED